MSQRLYHSWPAYRVALDNVAGIIDDQSGGDEKHFLDVLFTSTPPACPLTDDPDWCQLALFAVEYALARAWISLGVRPVAVTGHSVGEYAAAVLASVLTLPDAVAMLRQRTRLMAQACRAQHGCMLRLVTTRDVLQDLLLAARERLNLKDTDEVFDSTLAVINGPTNLVVAGSIASVQMVQAEAKRRGVEAKILRTEGAFHCALMESAAAGFLAWLTQRQFVFREPSIPFISSVHGQDAGPAYLTPTYWSEQIRRPVQFEAAVKSCSAMVQRAVFLEIGPHPILARLGEEIDGTLCWLSSLQHKRDDLTTVLLAAARLYEEGCLDVELLRESGLVPLPSNVSITHRVPLYEFDESRYAADIACGSNITLSVPLQEVTPGGVVFIPPQGDVPAGEMCTADITIVMAVNSSTCPWIADHVIEDVVVIPAAFFAVMPTSLQTWLPLACRRDSASHFDLSTGAVIVSDIRLLLPAPVWDCEDGIRIRVHVAQSTSTTFTVCTYADANAVTKKTSSAEVCFDHFHQVERPANRSFDTNISNENMVKVDVEAFYGMYRTAGVQFGS